MERLLKRVIRSKKLDRSPLTRRFVRWLRRQAYRPRVESYLRRSAEPKLHVGCGPFYIEGWLNTDMNIGLEVDAFLDAREPLPFEDGQFHFVYAEHMIEHVTFTEGRRFCKEVFRVLRPGGVVRVSTPDLRFLLRYYEDPSDAAREFTDYHSREFLRETVRSKALVLSNFFYDFGHRIVYDWELLEGVLREAGFLEIERREVGESPHPQLRGIEQHGRNYPFNARESMVVEATRPLA